MLTFPIQCRAFHGMRRTGHRVDVRLSSRADTATVRGRPVADVARSACVWLALPETGLPKRLPLPTQTPAPWSGRHRCAILAV